MGLMQLIYASRPFGFDEAMLNGILADARRNNPRHDITGALICRADIYLQLLEGPEEALTGLFDRIRRDDRHVEVVELRRAEVTDRLFPAWAMRDDPARSWMWTQEEVTNGAVARATPQEALAIFTRLAEAASD
jgi:hypothetical protein